MEQLLTCSRAIDPIFAVAVGVTAVVVRVNREEKEKGRTTQETIDSLRRRTASFFRNEATAKQASEKAG